MLTKTNLKAIRMADKFIFAMEGGNSHIRCIKKGQADENEPFTQPDVHHDIACSSDMSEDFDHDAYIECENDSVVETVLNSLKEDDAISLEWRHIDTDPHHYMLSLHIRRKEKSMSYILALKNQQEALRQVA